jgi:hypothetical protein
LSKKELKNLTSIKPLRMKNIEAEKIQMDTQKKLDKVISDHTDAQAKITKLTEENKHLNGECYQDTLECIANILYVMFLRYSSSVITLTSIQNPSGLCMRSTSARTSR